MNIKKLGYCNEKLPSGMWKPVAEILLDVCTRAVAAPNVTTTNSSASSTVLNPQVTDLTRADHTPRNLVHKPSNQEARAADVDQLKVHRSSRADNKDFGEYCLLWSGP
jgi:hypothetical protein